MTLPGRSLQDSLLSHTADGRTPCVPQPFDWRGKVDDNCMYGIIDVHDDYSVHADHWEYHPAGDEILYVLEGRLLATVDRDGATEEAEIERGQAFIVPRQSWHRLQVLEPGRLFFFTPRAGTQLRPHDTGAACQAGSAHT